MNQSLISIIIPSFNNENTIKETIESLLVQSYSCWECIVIDDGSTDDTISIIEQYSSKYQKIKFNKRNHSPKGVSTSRNIGIQQSEGAYVIFLDSDDLLHPDCLKNRILIAYENPEFDFWVFKMEEFHKVIGDINLIHNTYTENNSRKEYLNLFLKGINCFSVAAPLWRKEALVKLGGFNENLQLWEDPELHIRALANKLKFKVNQDDYPDCYYRNDRELKKKNRSESIFLDKLYKNTFIFYKSIIKLFEEKNIKSSNKKFLAYNMIRFIHLEIILYKNFKQFLKFSGLALFNKVINIKVLLLLTSWFLIHKFGIYRIGNWTQDTLRKRVYYLVDS